MWQYSSKEVLRGKLATAIENSPTMDADIRLNDGAGFEGVT